jgi:RNA polymerase sigma factor (sigma-70 family)
VITMPSAATADLVRDAALGDSASWDALVDRFTPLLWSISRGFRLDTADAADVIQTTWLRLLENVDRIKDPEHVGAWLATTARRECLRQLRRTGRVRPTEIEDLDAEDTTLPPVDTQLLVAERDGELWQAFEQLPDRCRTLLRVLMTDPPPSYEEVSAALEMPVGSIGPTRGRCLDRLRTLLEGSSITADRAGSPKQSQGGQP